MRRWSLGKVLALLVALNLVLGVALFMLRSPPAAPEESLPPPQLPAQVEQVRAQMAQGRHGQLYTLVLSDAELTALVGYVLATKPDVPFTRVRVAVAGQRVVVDGVTKGLAVTLPVRVIGVAGAKDGLPWAQVENVSLGETQVPGFLRDQVVRQVNASLDFSRYDLPVTVDILELSTGMMTLKGTVK